MHEQRIVMSAAQARCAHVTLALNEWCLLRTSVGRHCEYVEAMSAPSSTSPDPQHESKAGML
eukprot:8220681-Alexandrium_andersonii.AAC.1